MASASTLQLGGVPVDPISFPNLPQDNTPKVPPPFTDFNDIEAAILTAIGRSKPGAEVIHPAAVIDTQTPAGYDFIFGPFNGATGAPGVCDFVCTTQLHVFR